MRRAAKPWDHHTSKEEGDPDELVQRVSASKESSQHPPHGVRGGDEGLCTKTAGRCRKPEVSGRGLGCPQIQNTPQGGWEGKQTLALKGLWCKAMTRGCNQAAALCEEGAGLLTNAQITPDGIAAKTGAPRKPYAKQRCTVYYRNASAILSNRSPIRPSSWGMVSDSSSRDLPTALPAPGD